MSKKDAKMTGDEGFETAVAIPEKTAKKKRTVEEMVVWLQKELAHLEEGALDANFGLKRIMGKEGEEDAIIWHKKQIAKASKQLGTIEARAKRCEEELQKAQARIDLKKKLVELKEEYRRKQQAIKDRE